MQGTAYADRLNTAGQAWFSIRVPDLSRHRLFDKRKKSCNILDYHFSFATKEWSKQLTFGERVFVKRQVTRRAIKTSPNVSLDDVIRDLNRLSDGIDESNQNSARRKYGRLGRFGRSAGRMIGPLNNALALTDFLTPPQEEEWTNLGSWVEYGRCATPSPSYNLDYGLVIRTGVANSTTTKNFTNNCLAGQALVDSNSVGDPWAYVLNSSQSVSIGRTTIVGGSPRGQCQIAFTRPNTGAFPKPQLKLAIVGAALPSLSTPSWPVTAFPDEFPPMAAPAFTDAIPWALAPHAPKGDAAEPSLPSMQPSRQRLAWSVAITSAPAGADRGAAGKPPKHHDYVSPSERPNRPVKERKVRPGPRMAKALKALGFITEALDTVDALYNALPSEFRPRWKNTRFEKRNVSPREKMLALLQHWDKVDIVHGVHNLIYQNVQDRIYGEIGKFGGQVSKATGRSYGTGINSLLKRTTSYSRELKSDTQ